MKDQFSTKDIEFMQIALEEAKKAYEEGNYPCGAVVTIDDEILDQGHNLKEVKGDRVSHAEMLLYIKDSSSLKKLKKEGKKITIYTTLEPCLMCFGAACIHRVDRIVVASPDPYGNMSKIKDAQLGSFYSNNLPELQYGLLYDEVCSLTVKYLEEKGGEESMQLIKTLKELSKSYK